MSSGNNLLKVLVENFDVFALPIVSLVYPLYASVKAIETKSIQLDDHQWLTYWVLYSLIALFELTFSKVVDLFPVWSYAKLIGTCWLVLPQFNGAAHVYERFARPLYMSPSRLWHVPRNKNVVSKPDDVLTAAERYIEEHGSGAFEEMIRKADKETRVRRSNNYTIFDDDYAYY